MIFTEFRFLFFFLVVFAVYWSVRANRVRKAWLVLCSYAFYAAWDWRFCSLIIVSTLVDYVVGRALMSEDRPKPRKRWLQFSLAANLGMLGVFKYFNFFVDSGIELFQFLGLPASEVTLRVILPIGISFYTFQTLSYSIDVYARRLQPTRDLLDLGLFVCFFPQLVAGPIVRAREMLPQLRSPRKFASIDFRACLTLFLIGFVKKAVVSDGISPYVDEYFAAPQTFDTASAWMGLLLYTVQAYCDFSAYSDMATATAGLLGFNLRINFYYPYFAVNMSQFWRRWHMSLSTWLRDYLFIPLGGSRGSNLATCRNIVITLVLSGLWHGAGWHFVAFGAMQAAALVAYRQWALGPGQRIRIPSLVANLVTMLWFSLSLAYFRAPDFATGTTVVLAAMGNAEGGRLLADRLLWVAIGLGCVHWISYRRWLVPWWSRMPGWAFAAAYGVLAALAFSLIHYEAEPFIYFQF